jgi:hypothetical protein
MLRFKPNAYKEASMRRPSKMKHLLALLIFALGLALLNSLNKQQLLDSQAAYEPLPLVADSNTNVLGTDVLIAEAFRNGRSNVQLGGEGIVSRILADDNEGSRHQRFLVRLASGQSLLVAHNIDLAPRIEQLRNGDSIEFYGEYEWNAKGGVIHWTHHDPKGIHSGGWLKHQGRVYR